MRMKLTFTGECMKQYEATKLRRVFLDEMSILEPRWAEIFSESRIKRDLDYAVNNCDAPFTGRSISYWCDDAAAERHNMLTLDDRTYGYHGPEHSKDDIVVL
jgi:hypothetical protein